MASGHQHELEFGGSSVGTEFPGRLRFRLADRVPVIELSHSFDEEAARAVRYSLVATVGPERPFYHRYLFVVLDVRMVGPWKPGSGEFVAALADRLKQLGGALLLVTTTDIPVPGELPRFDTPEEAVAEAKRLRADRRLARMSVP